MPRIKGSGKGPSDLTTLRLEPDVKAFYVTKANEHGISLSEYLRQLLTAGVVAESVQHIEMRLGAVLEQLHVSQRQGGLPDSAMAALFLSEELLKKIVNDTSPQDLYAAQDRVQQRLAALKGGGGNG